MKRHRQFLSPSEVVENVNVGLLWPCSFDTRSPGEDDGGGVVVITIEYVVAGNPREQTLGWAPIARSRPRIKLVQVCYGIRHTYDLPLTKAVWEDRIEKRVELCRGWNNSYLQLDWVQKDHMLIKESQKLCSTPHSPTEPNHATPRSFRFKGKRNWVGLFSVGLGALVFDGDGDGDVFFLQHSVCLDSFGICPINCFTGCIVKTGYIWSSLVHALSRVLNVDDSSL
ncbi:hypothetical protein V6N13_143835 [Hibiscus sabdariffa]|uniref:Uncharacterized protein n=1 Tax=Hibiscus sabdariffa TaxID=183260 RepID=A0ABR2FIT3_9ROSI